MTTKNYLLGRKKKKNKTHKRIDGKDGPTVYCNCRTGMSDLSDDWDDVDCKMCLRILELKKEFERVIG